MLVGPFTEECVKGYRVGRLVAFKYDDEDTNFRSTVSYKIEDYPFIIWDIHQRSQEEFYLMEKEDEGFDGSALISRSEAHRLLKEWRMKDEMKRIFK